MRPSYSQSEKEFLVYFSEFAKLFAIRVSATSQTFATQDSGDLTFFENIFANLQSVQTPVRVCL